MCPACLSANFPIPGITFIDFLPLLRTPGDFEMLLTHFMNHIYNVTMPTAGVDKIDVVVGLDARGFLLGSVHTHARPLITFRINRTSRHSQCRNHRTLAS